MNSNLPAYQRLLTASHIYLTCQRECYINYGRLGIAVFRWLVSSEDLEQLRQLKCPEPSKFARVLGYESQTIAQDLKLPASLVQHAFIEVISNEHNRAAKLIGRHSK